MITKDNLKDLLIFLGYEEENENYKYHFKNSDCDIFVDFDNEKIIYPTDKGMIVNERQTINFSDNENFVVLECIHRLLEKGYKPSHIEIERRWSLGHLSKSGRADICVMNATGNDVLFIIECKTFGNEFEKELKTLKSDGGQLFSYYQQEKSAKWLMLYASDFEDYKILHQIKTVPVFDTENILEKYKKDKNLDIYEKANSKEKTFETWVNTYDKKIYDDLIFSEDTIAYNIGEKPLRKKDLKEFNPNDKIVNKFEEILRHNNVSDKENAFNKLTALFICKLVDEITKGENDIVDFQYKFGTDTFETLLDRLQRLYKEGMDKFMKEDIFYVSSEYPLNLFSTYKGQNRKNAIEDLKETFRKLKFYSNSDFAFKDVHNEELFKQNGKILVEVVKLFENYRIVYKSKHQFLGDLFEQLLNQGFKQNEGQFFTPIPITRFIWESLPIENLKSLSKEDIYPKVIDYACGSGHFLTEGIDLINKVKGNSNNDWVSENIYGIEKDYRLARVSKISLFMNGAGEGNIIFGDGLDNHREKGVENNSFDILVANPPYSVKAFKPYLELKENTFELNELISNQGSEIEVLFVERIAQLLKSNGIAAVILPSSILSNTSNAYIGARGEILKNFKIKAISQFGNKTFSATGTNTVVLFLEKYKEPPKYYKMVEDNIRAIFNNQKSNLWKDDEILIDYLRHLSVDIELYSDFIEERLDYDKFSSYDYFKMYVDLFNKSTEMKNIKKRKTFKNLSIEEQKNILNTRFYSKVKDIEKEKLFYFALVRNQETLIIKSPSKVAEQTKFLGYQWFNRKGSEGIKIKQEGGVLYNPKGRESKNYIAPLVKNSFNNILNEIDESLEKYISIVETKNMLDFSREKFDRAIKLRKVIKFIPKSKFPIKSLEEVFNKDLIIRKGTSITKDQSIEGIYKVVAGGINFAYLNKEYNRNEDVITISASGANAGYVNYWDEKIFASDCTTIQTGSVVTTKYVYFYLKSLQSEIFRLAKGAAQPHVYPDDIKKFNIPEVPIDIQQKIIDECVKLEDKYKNTRMKIEEYRLQIQKIFQELDVIKPDGGGGTN